jgi:methyl-accepting chemotaxis protein
MSSLLRFFCKRVRYVTPSAFLAGSGRSGGQSRRNTASRPPALTQGRGAGDDTVQHHIKATMSQSIFDISGFGATLLRRLNHLAGSWHARAVRLPAKIEEAVGFTLSEQRRKQHAANKSQHYQLLAINLLERGDLTVRLYLRKRDYLKEESDAFNQAAQALSDRMEVLAGCQAEIEKALQRMGKAVSSAQDRHADEIRQAFTTLSEQVGSARKEIPFFTASAASQ